MPDIKQPQDRKPKADKKAEDFFTFTAGDREITMPLRTADVINMKFIRANRRREEIDYVLTAVEALAGESDEGEEIMSTIDDLSRDEMTTFLKAFNAHLASLGD